MVNIPLNLAADESVEGYFDQGIRAAARLQPGKVALTDARGALSYQEMIASIDRVATAIKRRFRPSFPVLALPIRPSVKCIVSALALTELGVAWIPINSVLSGEKLQALLTITGVEAVLGRLPSGGGHNVPEWDPYSATLDGSLGRDSCAGVRLGDAHRFIASRGTTGQPSVHSESMLDTIGLVELIGALDQYTPETHILMDGFDNERWYALLAVLSKGGSVTVSPTGASKVTHNWLSTCPSHAFLGAYTLSRICKKTAVESLPLLERLTVTGGHLHPPVAQALVDRVASTLSTLYFVTGFGFICSTEMTSGSIRARVIEGVELNLSADAESTDQSDVIRVRRISFPHDGNTALQSDVGTWFDTGDVGSFDRDGLKVLGKSEHFGKYSGSWLRQFSLESAINTLPEVKLACILSANDAMGRERLFVVAEPESGLDINLASVDAVLHEVGLTDAVVLTGSLPRVAPGAIDRDRVHQELTKFA